jgi:hypothetical protein
MFDKICERLNKCGWVMLRESVVAVATLYVMVNMFEFAAVVMGKEYHYIGWLNWPIKLLLQGG